MFGFPGNTSMQLQQMQGQQSATLQPQQDVVRVYEKGLWSTFSHTDATAVAGKEYRFFATQKGQAGQGHSAQLGEVETNMREGGKMQNNEAFDCLGLACLIFNSANVPTVYTDMATVCYNSMLEWDFSSNRLEIATTYLVGAGGGIFGSTADIGAADGTTGSRLSLNNGTGAVWLYRIPMILSAGTNFAIVQRFGQYATAVDGGASAYSLFIRLTMLGRFQSAING
jgi:hypothetical protein